MFSPSLVCGINVCLVQMQHAHDMQENVRQSKFAFSYFCRLFNLKKKLASFHTGDF